MHAQPNIIFDTDMGSDCDDAGALAMLHKLADKGEVNILGVMFSSGKNKYGIGVCDAINTYYGRGDLPLGQYKDNDIGDTGNTYSIDIAKNITKYHHNIIDSAEEIVAAYKQLLEKQPNGTVTILTVGHPYALYLLMQDKKGMALVKKKVKQWIAMTYTDTLPKRDWNFGKNGIQPYITPLLKQWNKPFYISSYGGTVLTGNKKLPLVAENNPVKQAYRLWKNKLVDGRPSWDQVTVLYAARPALFKTDSMGSLVQDNFYQTHWDTSITNKNHHKVVPIISNDELVTIIEDLMTELPSIKK